MTEERLAEIERRYDDGSMEWDEVDELLAALKSAQAQLDESTLVVAFTLEKIPIPNLSPEWAERLRTSADKYRDLVNHYAEQAREQCRRATAVERERDALRAQLDTLRATHNTQTEEESE